MCFVCHRPVNLHGHAERDAERQLQERDAGGAMEHFGHATTDASVDLDDLWSLGGELDLGVQAARGDAERLDRRRGEPQGGLLVDLVQGRRNEEAGLAENSPPVGTGRSEPGG